jgi:hypothetical protein
MVYFTLGLFFPLIQLQTQFLDSGKRNFVNIHRAGTSRRIAISPGIISRRMFDATIRYTQLQEAKRALCFFLWFAS